VINPSHMELRNTFPANGDFQLARAFVREGIPVAIGSDGPLNPWLNFLLVTYRQQQPNESLSREQALAAYTTGSAFAEMKEKEKGTIAVGKLADLAVLSQDIFEVEPPLLPETRSVLTVIDGKVVYSALP
jgi:predicted amidohydrolase YtcJ